jgi:hypothetical protein
MESWRDERSSIKRSAPIRALHREGVRRYPTDVVRGQAYDTQPAEAGSATPTSQHQCRQDTLPKAVPTCWFRMLLGMDGRFSARNCCLTELIYSRIHAGLEDR